MQEESLAKRILKSAGILIVAVIIIIGLAIGMGAVGIPLWPFIFLLFYYSSFDKFDPSKFKMTAIGTGIGIFVGMSQGIFTQLTGSSVAGTVIMVCCVLVLGTAFIMGDVPWASIYGILTMTFLTLFSLDPCVWAGMPAATGMGWIEAFLRVMASFFFGVVVFSLVNIGIKKKAAQTMGQQSVEGSAQDSNIQSGAATTK